jgi:hypothetical protein
LQSCLNANLPLLEFYAVGQKSDSRRAKREGLGGEVAAQALAKLADDGNDEI